MKDAGGKSDYAEGGWPESGGEDRGDANDWGGSGKGGANSRGGYGKGGANGRGGNGKGGANDRGGNGKSGKGRGKGIVGQKRARQEPTADANGCWVCGDTSHKKARCPQRRSRST